MTGTPNGLRVHWAQDTELVAENDGSMLQHPLPQHGDHGPKGPDVETAASTQSQIKGKASHGCVTSPNSCGKIPQGPGHKGVIGSRN